MATTKKNNSKNSDFLVIEVLRYNPYSAKKGQKTNLLGFATVSVNGVAFSGIRHMTGKNGNWISFPAEQSGDTWYPTVWFNFGDKTVNAEAYDRILEAIENYVDEEIEE